ncbi:MAG: response regulator [Lachnospiraceae bacterium]
MRVICVDDELPILENFRITTKDFQEIEDLQLFQDGKSALEWAEKHPVDTAFLDMEMAGMNGLELAKRLKQLDQNIRIIFVTAYTQYALDAFGVNALGYVLKPYTKEEIRAELDKALLMRSKPKKRVVIKTIPSFSFSVEGIKLNLGGSKPEELLALIVDSADAGITAGEVISYLWPGRLHDEATQNLYRVTVHRLMDVLKEAGVEHIIVTNGKKRYIRQDQVECDLFRILNGDKESLVQYGGDYMKEYSWAEARNAQLNSMKEQM